MMKTIRDAVLANAPMQTLVRGLCRSGLVPRAIYVRLPAFGLHPVRSPAGNRFAYVALPYDRIARSVVWGNLAIWEASSLRAWSELVRSARCILDVGAYSGIYSLVACADGPASVFAFEPNPAARELLEGNIRANRLGDRIVVVPKGASSHSGQARMHVPDDNTAARVEADARGDGPLIELTTIDEVTHGRRVDLIKIDAEGLEPDILLGARATITQNRPPLLMECLDRDKFDALGAIARSYGYTAVEHMGSAGARPVTRFVEEPGFANFLWRASS